MDQAEPTPPVKRGRGRPKGSKNKPTAGHVGRPRKDGRPPQKKDQREDVTQCEAPALPVGPSRAPDDNTSSGQSDSNNGPRENGVVSTCSTQPTGLRSLPPPPTLESCQSAPVPHIDSGGTQTPSVSGHDVLSSPSPLPLAIPPIDTSRPTQCEVARIPSDSDPSTGHTEHGDTTNPGPPTQKQPWRHDSNVPVRPPSPVIPDQPQSHQDEFVYLDNIYGSDLATNTDDPNPMVGADEDEDALDEEFRQRNGEEDMAEDESSALPSGRTGPHVHRGTLPLWLDSHYKTVETMLKSEIEKSKCNPPRPKCYEEGQFWVWNTSPVLTLVTQPNMVLEPSIFHRPSFFIWLPHCLLGDRIPCPQCKASGRRASNGRPVFLQKLGWVGKPRRAVDLDRNVYIIGYRYRCGVAECRKTYRSWSHAILNILPPAISSQFPFQLTYRSGLSNRVAELLRSSIRAGIGPALFTEMLQSFHYQRFDELHLQYLEMVQDRYKGCPNPRHFWIPKPSFGSFSDRDGYGGFIPSQGYFRRFYDKLIEQHTVEMKQSIAMLPARVLAIDHSFKIIKRLGRVGNAPLFAALHTVTNEYAEIRSMLFTMTKGHDQYIPNLHEINSSLKTFGHSEVQAVFTDNVRADKAEVQRAFPSLLKDVVPIPAHSELPVLEFPRQSYNIVELSTTHQINLRFDIIMNNRHLDNHPVSVAFDMEWPVDLSTGIQGLVSVIQIAHLNTVYLIRTINFIRDGCLHLPHSFLAFMRSPCFLKAGVNINSDFKRLQRDCGFGPGAQPFVGQVELSTMAKTRGVQIKRNAGLADLVAVLLKKYLPKDPQIRVSPHWGDIVLPPEFTQYATLDGYATLAVYLHLSAMQPISAVTSNTPRGTHIALVSPDGRQVARGIVAVEQPAVVDGVNVTSSRMVMTVSHVLVPGFLIPASLCKTHHSSPLSFFGNPPFNLVATHNSLHTYADAASDVEIITPILTLNSESIPEPQDPSLSPLLGSSNASQMEDLTTPEIMPEYFNLESMEDISGAEDNGDDATDPPEQSLEGSVRDPGAEVMLAQLMEPYIANLSGPPNPVIRTRVIYDNFHCHHQFPISQHHGLRRPFHRALTSAFFIPVAEDKAAVEMVLKRYQTSYDSQMLSKPKWMLARIRRHVPPPEILLPRVADVLNTYGPLKDAKTGEPLFNARAWEIAKNVMENVRLGYYSDPSGVELYFKMGQDRDGLTLYRCCRGTNSVEGGVHQNLIRHYNSFNSSPEHAINVLLDYTVRHNMVVGTLNRTGKAYVGHFNVPLKNRIARMLNLTRDAMKSNPAAQSGWVNGNDYAPVNETFGVVKLSPTFFKPLGMFEYSAQYALDQKIRHRYIAERQGSLLPILPVHTREERDLFQLLASSSPHFSDSRQQPNWSALVNIWSGHADGKVIFYKLPEHLKAYYKIWTDFCNEHNTISLNADASRRIRALVRSASSSSSVQAPTALPLTVRDSLTISPSVDIEEIHSWQITNLLHSHSLQQSALLYLYADTLTPQGQSSNTKATTGSTNLNPRKRKSPPAAEASTTNTDRQGPSKSKPPRVRHCVNCRSADCPGRWASRKCPLPLRPALQ